MATISFAKEESAIPMYVKGDSIEIEWSDQNTGNTNQQLVLELLDEPGAMHTPQMLSLENGRSKPSSGVYIMNVVDLAPQNIMEAQVHRGIEQDLSGSLYMQGSLKDKNKRGGKKSLSLAAKLMIAAPFFLLAVGAAIYALKIF